MYRCNIIDPRVENIAFFNSISKSFMYGGLLEKPEQITLYRETQRGGLDFVHIECQAKAALIMTFLQTAINPNFQSNNFIQKLYLHYVQNESIPTPKIPPNLAGDFFPTICKLKAAKKNFALSTIKTIFDFLIADTLRVEDQEADLTLRSLIPLKCEKSHPETDWKRS